MVQKLIELTPTACISRISATIAVLGITLTGCAVAPQATTPIEERLPPPVVQAPLPLPPEEPSTVQVFPMEEPERPLSRRTVPLESEPSRTFEPPPESVEAPAPLEPPAPQSAAVVALLGNAERQESSGQYDSAAAALERALRIEPRNAALWQRLAEIRLQQKQPDQAETLAAKSNSLAGRNSALQAGNWRIIARARQQQGDADGARAAAATAQALAGRLR